MKKTVIGRIDKINLPELKLFEIDAKIDTGAYTSAIHCHHISVVKMDGKNVLHFKLLDPFHPDYNDKDFYFERFTTRNIKNTSGIPEERFTIKTVLEIFDEKIETEFSLTDREKMKYPILLGRRFLSGKFIVDVEKKDLSFKQKKK
ncbi:ATP-dependent zinc protease family protein [Flexithrix dorotheae]|uniref:ATP-dependent zinc protease family protein n=1 Tax=Flexithrix dorotheae TaxID=70993 RepID=UPI00037E2F39|nr:RimK/LysX family protein [Flexithrix dorotheae]